MDININSNLSIRKPELENGVPEAKQQAKIKESPNLSISQASAPLIDETLGTEVPEAALTRNDKLGNLISAAFNMPAPPMPSFETK